MRKIKHIIEYITVIFLFILLRSVPYKMRISIGGFLGLLVYFFYKKRRDVALSNIALSFPDMTHGQHVAICRNSFKNTGKAAMEFIQLSGPSFNESFTGKYIIIEGEERLKRALKKGRGIIGICPHLGNWEFVAAFIASQGYDLAVIMKRQSNPYVNRFIEAIRSRYKMELIYRTGAGTHVLRALRKNKIVGFVADQDAGRNGVFVDFMGRPASTARGPSRFALSNGSPVLLFTGIREKGNKLRIFVDNVQDYDYEFSENENRDFYIKKNTQSWTNAVEQYVRKYPDQYFWMHRRWKTMPCSKL